MRFTPMTRFTPMFTASAALTLLLALGSPARAQSASPDLSGTWSEASGGQATFAKRSDGSYDVTWKNADGSVTTGRATFDGGKLAVQVDSKAGMTSQISEAMGGPAAARTSKNSGYSYESNTGDPYDRMDLTSDGGAAIAGGGELRRQRPGALSSPLPDDEYGGAAQRAATRALVADAEGNKDGIVGNEGNPANDTSVLSWLSLQPFVDKIRNWVDARSSDKPALDSFVAAREAAWGEPVTQLAPDALPDMGRFRAEKAALLTRFNRTPDEVTDGFVAAAGSVDGNAIAPRNVFVQEWKPIGKANGRVVVVSPGFQETGREFVEQANALNKQGYDVILMDNQWSGYTVAANPPATLLQQTEADVAGMLFGANAKTASLKKSTTEDDTNPGGIDRGFGIARDVAAAAAHGNEVASRDYGNIPGHEVILLGNSMGGGPGVLGALTLNDAGLVKLDGAQMPKGVNAVLEAPFIQMTSSLMNNAVKIMAHVPGVDAIEMPSAGLPVLSHDDVANAKFANHAVSEDVRAQLGAMIASNDDMTKIRALVDAGKGPSGKVYVIHADHDPLADPAGSQWLVGRLGGRGKLNLIHANDHVLEESPSEQNYLAGGVQWIDPQGASAAGH